MAFQYVDPAGEATLCAPYNPNGSSYGIEGIISASGQILGKMGHTERYEENLFKNIHGNKQQSIFANAQIGSPTNFVVRHGVLYYIDFECNHYMEEWNFDNWGNQYWWKSPEFLKAFDK